jgi:hypothetical protein
MSIEDPIIDFVSIDKNQSVVLTISDHLEWDDENEHLLLLQNKINNYIASIENGSFYENYPKGKDRSIVIEIVAKQFPNKKGKIFLKQTKTILESAGLGFSFSIIDS